MIDYMITILLAIFNIRRLFKSKIKSLIIKNKKSN